MPLVALRALPAPYLFGYLNTRMGSFSYGLAVMIAALAGGLLMLCTPRSARALDG
jgi:hypothetical protein